VQHDVMLALVKMQNFKAGLRA